MNTLGVIVSTLALSVSLQQSGRTNSTAKQVEKWEVITTASLSVSGLTRLNSRLAIFAGSTAASGDEPWITNGTTQGTTILADIFPGTGGSKAQGFTRYAGEVFFYADDGVHGMEVWRTDGTQKGTKMLADLVPGPGGLSPLGLSAANHRLYIPVVQAGDGRVTLHVFIRDGFRRDE